MCFFIPCDGFFVHLSVLGGFPVTTSDKYNIFGQFLKIRKHRGAEGGLTLSLVYIYVHLYFKDLIGVEEGQSSLNTPISF